MQQRTLRNPLQCMINSIFLAIGFRNSIFHNFFLFPCLIIRIICLNIANHCIDPLKELGRCAFKNATQFLVWVCRNAIRCNIPVFNFSRANNKILNCRYICTMYRNDNIRMQCLHIFWCQLLQFHHIIAINRLAASRIGKIIRTNHTVKPFCQIFQRNLFILRKYMILTIDHQNLRRCHFLDSWFPWCPVRQQRIPDNPIIMYPIQTVRFRRTLENRLNWHIDMNWTWCAVCCLQNRFTNQSPCNGFSNCTLHSRQGDRMQADIFKHMILRNHLLFSLIQEMRITVCCNKNQRNMLIKCF